MIANAENTPTPSPIRITARWGQVSRSTSPLKTRTAIQAANHFAATAVSACRSTQTKRCRANTTMGSLAANAANAAARVASSLQRQARERTAAQTMGINSIAVAPCSRGRNHTCCFGSFAGLVSDRLRIPLSLFRIAGGLGLTIGLTIGNRPSRRYQVARIETESVVFAVATTPGVVNKYQKGEKTHMSSPFKSFATILL